MTTLEPRTGFYRLRDGNFAEITEVFPDDDLVFEGTITQDGKKIEELETWFGNGSFLHYHQSPHDLMEHIGDLPVAIPPENPKVKIDILGIISPGKYYIRTGRKAEVIDVSPSEMELNFPATGYLLEDDGTRSKINCSWRMDGSYGLTKDETNPWDLMYRAESKPEFKPGDKVSDNGVIMEAADKYKHENRKFLRRQYAIAALTATLSHERNMVCLGSGLQTEIKNMAEDCFVMADAMLKAEGE